MKQTPSPQISCAELASRLAGANPPLVIDVLPDEEYRAAHLPGAKNACVFKVTFLDDMKQLASDRNISLVVYGASSGDLASTTAAEKLLEAGYTQVADYRGGLADWRAAGQPVDGNATTTKGILLPDGTHPINPQKTRIEWTGRNLMSAHSGTIKLQAGSIEVRNGHPVRGTFTFDMNSIENTDVQDPKMRELLVWHLKSDDFFDVQHFPVAELELTKVTPLPAARAGSPNYEMEGKLTLKGVTAEISLPAMVAPTADGVLGADAHFDIDRTRWNVLYGSGKFYEKLGKNLVNDDISLALKLVTVNPSLPCRSGPPS
jgi:polyisoprenoid-binding protein YceI/rhodanese-related sulfurtransferase